MKHHITAILSLFISITAFAQDEQIPAISSACHIRSTPGGKDRSAVDYTWVIEAKSSEDRVLSIDQLARTHPEKWKLPMIRGWQKFLFCKAGSTHEREVRLVVDQAQDGGEGAFWFEGFLTGLVNEDNPLPETATVSVTTRRISDGHEPGQLIGITVADNGRELSRHFLFISFISPAALQAVLPPEATEEERDPRDGKAWQIFTDGNGWEPELRRFTELDQ